MESRERWACPDLGLTKPEGEHLPIPGSKEAFADCPAYYLRMAHDGLPAEHLIGDITHPATIVSEWAVEIENGARNVETLSPKGREAVHLFLREKHDRTEHDMEVREEKRAKERAKR